MNRQRAHEVVASGAELFDLIEPNWPYIVPENMNIRFHCECALAWLYGDFTTGVRALNLSRPEIFGFFVRGNQEDPQVIADYALLTEEWREQIALRLTFVTQFEMEMERSAVA